MGQDGEIGQGPHTQMMLEGQASFDMMLAADRRVERRLAWFEIGALVLAALVLLACLYVAGRL